jgi:sugar phosphate isomerase/epimerase
MKIRYVVSTMVFWGRENKLSFEQECELIKSMGFGVELWPYIKGHAECRYDRRNWDRLVDATKGMLVSIHSRDDDPTLEKWQEQIECARLLNANIVTDLRSFGFPDGADVNGSGLSADVVRMAKENNVKLCLETGSLKQIKKLGKKFDSIWYCLDTGYANVDAEFTFRQYVDALAERVAHLHLTDNYGKQDDHETPGVRGGISHENWDYLLKTLNKYDNDVIGSFEMSPCMPDVMIRHASKFLFDVLNWPNKPSQISNINGYK